LLALLLVTPRLRPFRLSQVNARGGLLVKDQGRPAIEYIAIDDVTSATTRQTERARRSALSLDKHAGHSRPASSEQLREA
jgi:hypothetical protein